MFGYPEDATYEIVSGDKEIRKLGTLPCFHRKDGRAKKEIGKCP